MTGATKILLGACHHELCVECSRYGIVGSDNRLPAGDIVVEKPQARLDWQVGCELAISQGCTSRSLYLGFSVLQNYVPRGNGSGGIVDGGIERVPAKQLALLRLRRNCGRL